MVKVKICGITNPNDARSAAQLGADALGFNFVKGSPRHVTKERARAIIEALPPFVTSVAVFANEPVRNVIAICEFCGIRTVQLHGDEPQRYLSELPRMRLIKAVRLESEDDLRSLARYSCDAFLLDTYVPGELGGTGATFDWQWARRAGLHAPIIIAGGLNVGNVAEAVSIARPYAVDVASGVESAPGKKDRKLMAEFIAIAKGVQT